MHRLRTATLPLVALLAVGALLLGACSSDDDSASSKKTTTTEKTTSTEKTTTTGSSGSTTTLSPADWEAAMSKAEEKVDGAKGDVCALLAVSQDLGGLPEPTTPEQGKRAVELLSTLLTSIADTAPAENAKESAAIRKVAEDIKAEGEKAGYSAEFLDKGPQALAGKEFSSAMSTFQSVASQNCGTTTTVAP